MKNKNENAHPVVRYFFHTVFPHTQVVFSMNVTNGCKGKLKIMCRKKGTVERAHTECYTFAKIRILQK